MTLGAPDIRKLALDEDLAPVVLEGVANGAVDFAHAEDTFIVIMALALKTIEQRHLRHAQNLAAINPMKKGTVPFLSN